MALQAAWVLILLLIAIHVATYKALHGIWPDYLRDLLSPVVPLARLVPLQFSSIKERHLAEPQRSTSSIKELAFGNEELFTFFNLKKKHLDVLFIKT